MLTVNEDILNRTIAHQVGVQRLAKGVVDLVVGYLRQADAELFEMLRQRIDVEQMPTSLSKINQLLKLIHTGNEQVFRQIGKELSSQLLRLARYEVDFSKELFDTVLPMDWTIVRPKAKFIKAIVDEEPLLGGLLEEWLEGVAAGRFQRLRAAIRLSAGETADQAIRRIRGTRSLQHKDGIAQLSYRSAARMTETLVNHVANKARSTVYRYNPDLIEGVMWTAVLDDVTCAHCGSLDGEWWSLDNVQSGGDPPLHPNCRCTLVPVVMPLADLDLDPREVTPALKAKLSGRPQRMTYQKWLSNQSKATQDDILGPQRAEVFRKGVPVKKFVDHSGRRYSLPQLRKIEKRTLQPKDRPRQVAVRKLRRNYGWKPDLPDLRDYLYAEKEQTEIALPVRVSLRDRMPPVFDQGNLGSCVANALTAALMFARGPNTPMLSRLDLYYKARLLEGTVDEDSGVEIRSGIKALRKWGVATEQAWPYKIRSYRAQPSEQAAAEDDQYRIKKYMRLKSHEDFMQCLATGYPFVGGFTVYDNFDDAVVVDDGILPLPTVDMAVLGGHAVLFTGYDTEFHNNPLLKESGLNAAQVPSVMYEVRNSFGDGFGDDGYFYMPASYVENRNLSDDFWTIRA